MGRKEQDAYNIVQKRCSGNGMRMNGVPGRRIKHLEIGPRERQ